MNTLIFKWRAPFGVRYPTLPDGSVPLRPLAATLGVTYQSLIRAFVHLPVVRDARPQKIKEHANDKGAWSLVIPASDLAALLLLARPRTVTPRLSALRAQHAALTLLHNSYVSSADQARAKCGILLYELEVERQRSDDLRRLLALSHTQAGHTLNEKRWSNNLLDEQKMLHIVELAAAGVSPKKIAFETGKSATSIQQFLAGRYRSVAALAFYEKYGKPICPDIKTGCRTSGVGQNPPSVALRSA